MRAARVESGRSERSCSAAENTSSARAAVTGWSDGSADADVGCNTQAANRSRPGVVPELRFSKRAGDRRSAPIERARGCCRFSTSGFGRGPQAGQFRPDPGAVQLDVAGVHIVVTVEVERSKICVGRGLVFEDKVAVRPIDLAIVVHVTGQNVESSRIAGDLAARDRHSHPLRACDAFRERDKDRACPRSGDRHRAVDPAVDSQDRDVARAHVGGPAERQNDLVDVEPGQVAVASGRKESQTVRRGLEGRGLRAPPHRGAGDAHVALGGRGLRVRPDRGPGGARITTRCGSCCLKDSVNRIVRGIRGGWREAEPRECRVIGEDRRRRR